MGSQLRLVSPFTRSMMDAARPNEETLMKNRLTVSPWKSRNATFPTSITFVSPLRNARAASRMVCGISIVRLKSPPVPEGKIPISMSSPV
jgi:hypothetical protein